MKKILSLFLLLTLVLPLCACSKKTDSETPQSSSTTQSTTIESTLTSESPSETTSDSTVPTTAAPTTSDKLVFQKTASIEEVVLVDENDIRITATSLSYETREFEIELTIENNSNKDLTFLSGTYGYSCNSINGMMIPDGYLNCDVAAGKKAKDSISFDYNTLMLYGITEIADIELAFDISDDDYNDIYTGPRQILTSLADTFNYTPDSFQNNIQSHAAQNTLNYTVDFFEEKLIYEESGISLLSQTLVYSYDKEPILLLEFENQSDEIVNIGIADISINNLTLSSGRWTSESVVPGKRCVIGVELYSITDEAILNALEIKQIASVGFEISLDDEDWKEISENQSVMVNIEGRESHFNKGETEVYTSENICVTSLGIVEDSSKYSDDMHALFVVENYTNRKIEVDIEYGSVSVNDYMISSYNSSVAVESSGYGLLKVEVSESELDDNSIDIISSIEFEIEIHDGHYNTIEECTLNVMY